MDYQHEYIRKNPSLHLEQAKIKADQILKFLGGMKVGSLIDVGCGAGGITVILKEKLSPVKTIGIDISKTMIDLAKRKNKDITWYCGDIFGYKHRDKVDLIIGIDIIEHIQDDIGLLKKMGRIGHKVLIKTPLEDSFLDSKIRKLEINDSWKDSENKYGHIHHYNDKQITKMCKDAGFKIVKSDYLPLPKRSKWLYEILRIIFLPLGWVSKRIVTNFVGGFKIILMESP